MDKLKMHTPNLTVENIEKLAVLFPNCVVEKRDEGTGQLKRAIDFDQLCQELSDHIVEGPRERYHLDWPGKREALLVANAPIAKTLRPCRQESVDFDATKNLFIEGDNLDALKLLQETYLGRVKLVYMDPPYNTGNDFIYEDDFAADNESYLVKSNQKDENGHRLVTNTESNGRFHSDWMSMIAPRLRLARNLLTQDGAIFVSCDEVEQPRLRLIMDEIFGQSNFVADMVWAGGRKNDSRLISVSHEYIVCYARDVEYLREHKIVWRQRKKGLEDIYKEYQRLKRLHSDDYAAMTQGMKSWYKSLPDSHPAKAHKHFDHVDFRGLYFPDNISWPGGGGPKYEVLHPITRKPVKVPSRGWITSDQSRMKQWIDDQRVHFGADENSVPCIKSYLTDKEQQTPYSVFYQDGRAASKRLRTLMGTSCFEFPKDELVLQEIVEMLTSGEDIILDCFAGSSTMAHAVLSQNAADGARRSFIMIQVAEPCAAGTEAANAGYQTIADIGKERIRRAGALLKGNPGSAATNLDIGFRVLKVDTSSMKDVYYAPDELQQGQLALHTDNIKDDRMPEDLLFQVLVDWGVNLSLPIEQRSITGRTVFQVDGNALVACFDTEIGEDLVKELAKQKPLRAVFRDSGYASDSTKINVEQLFKLLSPTTEVRSL